MRIVITGGGTGGHVFPGIAVAEALGRIAPETEILFVGGSKGIEATTVPKEGYPFVPIPARGLLGKRLFAIPSVGWTTIRGDTASGRILSEFKPDVVFATGGYVSGPVALAARMLRIPVVLQEQNSMPGLTNRLLSRFAREVFINFPAARKHFPRRGHLKLTGSPIRTDVLDGEGARAIQNLRLPNRENTVLIMGGSQGATSINRAAVAMVRRLRRRKDIQFILQTGRRDHRRVLRKLRTNDHSVCVRPFIQNMGDVYALADLVIARAGAMSLAEITACGKASILIPFPHATHNHQEVNAEALVDVGAAQMILDRDLTGEHLTSRIVKLIDTPSKLREMSNNAISLARPDAADKIASALLCYGRQLSEPDEEREETRRRPVRQSNGDSFRRSTGQQTNRSAGRSNRRPVRRNTRR